MTTKYEALQPINHKGHHYRPGDEITGFTGWWRYWQYLRYKRVARYDDLTAPTITSATRGNEQATVLFTAPDDGGSNFSYYQYQLDGGEWLDYTESNAVDDSQMVITGLTNGVTYSIKIRAVSAEMGPGAASSAEEVTPATKADIPTALVATPADATASIAFTIADDGGDAVTDVQYKIGTGAWTSTDPATTASPIVIPDLTAGTEYSVRLRSVNTVGSSNQSDAVVFTTTDVPDAPTALVATPGVLSASIAFTAPASNGSAITDYEYTMNAGGTWTSGAITASPLVLDPIPAVETTVAIRAINAVGAGPASADVVFTPSAA